MTEEWRPVVGFEGIYEVSRLGSVRSVDRLVRRKRDSRPFFRRGQLITERVSAQGVHYVSLRRGDGRTHNRTLAVVMLEAFVGPRPPGMVCCHYDDNKANNTLENLRWDTDSANKLDSVRNGTHAIAARTHCSNGHEFNAENCYWNGSRRLCRPCRRMHKRNYEAKVRARSVGVAS